MLWIRIGNTAPWPYIPDICTPALIPHILLLKYLFLYFAKLLTSHFTKSINLAKISRNTKLKFHWYSRKMRIINYFFTKIHYQNPLKVFRYFPDLLAFICNYSSLIHPHSPSPFNRHPSCYQKVIFAFLLIRSLLL